MASNPNPNITNSNQLNIAIASAQPKVYVMSMLYYPHIEGFDTTGTGIHVPKIGSIVQDDRKTPITDQYIVTGVDSVSYKTTLQPASIVSTNAGIQERVLSYGNDVLMVYYSKVEKEINGEMIHLTHLVVDDNLSLLGGNSAEYQLIRLNSLGEETVISVDIDTGNLVDNTRVPVVETPIDGIRKCGYCYSYYDLIEGELIYLRVYDANSSLIFSIKLFAKQALVLNDLQNQLDPVVGFEIDANQTEGDDVILYLDQNKSFLNFYPTLVYASGKREIVPVNSLNTFLYGWGDVETSQAHREYPLVFKHYLHHDVPSTIATGQDIRFVSANIYVRIADRPTSEISKLSFIPVYKSTAGGGYQQGWNYVVFAYYNDRRSVSRLTTNEWTASTSWNPALLNVQQVIAGTAAYSLGDGTPVEKTQTRYVEVRNPTRIDAFVMGDSTNATGGNLYGNNTGIYRFPYVQYVSAQQQYVIPVQFNSEEMFITNFYTTARPPFNSENESEPPTPTHFTCRNIDGRIIFSSVVPIANFQNVLPFIIENELYNEYVGQTVVFEFLKLNTAGIYEILFGTPVRVIV